MSEYTSPEDEAFFAAIGRLAISWSLAEAGIDFSVIMIHQALGGAAVEAERPRGLGRKLKFLKKAAKELPVLAPYKDQITDVCKQVWAASENRHDMIHGFVVEQIERSGEAKLIRIIHEDPIPRTKSVDVTTASILKEAAAANKLGGATAQMATDLKELLLATVNKPRS